MKNIVDFLGIDVADLCSRSEKILLSGVDIVAQQMFLRLATRGVEVAGFYDNDEWCCFPGAKLLGKPIYGDEQIAGEPEHFLLLRCTAVEEKHAHGGDIESRLNSQWIGRPLSAECIVYGAGYQGKCCGMLLAACGVNVLKFCDKNSARWHSEYEGREIISPQELADNYADYPVIVGLDPSIAEEVGQTLLSDTANIYIGTDPVFGIEMRHLCVFTHLRHHNKLLYGNRHYWHDIAKLLKFMGTDIAGIINDSGECDSDTDIPVHSPYDLCYEDEKETIILAQRGREKAARKILQVIGWGRYSLIEGLGGNGYEYHEFIDPNLGHNIDYRGEVSVMHLHTDITAGNKTTIGILGGSTSDISCFDTPSWPEQLIKIGEDQGKNLTLLCGGTGSYIVAQEVVKFLRDMSHQKMDILISYSGYNDITGSFWETEHKNRFVSAYQYRLFNSLAEIGKIREELWTTDYTMQIPAGIESVADHWLHYESMLYHMCKGLGIKFYAIYQPHINTKRHLTTKEKNYRLIDDLYYYCTTTYPIRKNLYVMQQGEKVIDKLKQAQKNCPWLYDFTDLFRDHDEQVYTDVCHLNEHGNFILAEQIYEIIKEQLN